MRGVLIALLLATCSQIAGPLPITTRTIADPMAYIAGGPARADWPMPGSQITLSVERDGRAIQTWDFPPLGTFEAAKGDGGQVLEVGADGWVRTVQTQDGGTPYMQYFVGPRCGGTGWINFGLDAPTGRWRAVTARLAIAPDPGKCPALGEAYTRYRRETVDMQFSDGPRTLDCIISEHYAGARPATAWNLERSWFCRGYGLTRWEAWGPRPPTLDLVKERRYRPAPYSSAPVAGWNLLDLRMSTVVLAKPPAPIEWPK